MAVNESVIAEKTELEDSGSTAKKKSSRAATKKSTEGAIAKKTSTRKVAEASEDKVAEKAAPSSSANASTKKASTAEKKESAKSASSRAKSTASKPAEKSAESEKPAKAEKPVKAASSAKNSESKKKDASAEKTVPKITSKASEKKASTAVKIGEKTPEATESKPARKPAAKKAAPAESEAPASKKSTSKAAAAPKSTASSAKGPKKLSVKDLKGAQIKDLDTIKDDLRKLADKHEGQISIRDIEKAIRFLDMSADEEMELAYGLAEEGILVVSEDGTLISAEGAEEDLEDDESLDESVDDIDDEVAEDGDELEDEGEETEDEVKGEAVSETKADDDFPDMPVQVDVKVSDPVKLYLKNIGHFPVLKSKEEETVLAKRIIAGNEASEKLEKLDRATADPQEIAELEYDVEDGQDAKETLTNCNLKLVVSIAKHYVNRGMQFLDLIQEGNIGLMKAVDKFDYTRGFKFSTYATWWIRQAITRALADQARTIRIPVHMVETINKIGRAQRKLVQVLNRDPTPEEISQELHGAYSAERIREIQQIALDPLSLEKPVGEEEDSHVGDFIEDKDNESPSEFATNSLLKDKLNEVLNDLSERERMVIRLRYGLIDGRTQTLEEVGKRFNVTRERIRQIEAKAIKKLRQPKRSNVLKDFRNGN